LGVFSEQPAARSFAQPGSKEAARAEKLALRFFIARQLFV
jgi:hypothetical protein